MVESQLRLFIFTFYLVIDNRNAIHLNTGADLLDDVTEYEAEGLSPQLVLIPALQAVCPR